jgi:predicted small secreted protein
MKKFIGIALISLLALVSFAGCASTANGVGSMINPVIGTWTTSNLIGSTELTINADKTCTQIYTLAGDLGVTKNGTWHTNDKLLSQVWAGNDAQIQYYTFNSDSSEMTLSSTPEGTATTYIRK